MFHPFTHQTCLTVHSGWFNPETGEVTTAKEFKEAKAKQKKGTKDGARGKNGSSGSPEKVTIEEHNRFK